MYDFHKEAITINSRTAADFPELQAAIEKLQDLRTKLAENETRLQRLDKVVVPSEKESRVAGIVRGLLGSRKEKEPERPAIAEDKRNTLEDNEAIVTAISQQTQALSQLRRETAEVLYREDYAELHRVKRARIAKGIVELAEAIIDERQYATTMMHAGALMDSTTGHRLLLNVSMCPQIWAAFSSLIDGPTRLKDFQRNNANLL